MARRYSRKSPNYSVIRKQKHSDEILSSNKLGHLKKALIKCQYDIEQLDGNLAKIKNITDSEAENYIRKIKQLFQKEKECKKLPRKPTKPEHGLLKYVFMKWEYEQDENTYRADNLKYDAALKKQKDLLDEIIVDFDKFKEELKNEYGTKLWSYTSYDINAGQIKGISLVSMYETQNGYHSTQNESQSIQLIDSPSDFREYLSEINMRDKTRSIRTKISRRILQLESLPSNRREAKFKAIIARDEGSSRSLARSVKNELEITKNCPYCEHMLDSNYHADHIIPVTYGGYSVTQNMVNVCAKCNTKKGGDTLMNFCQKNGYDFMGVASRLQSMGKRV